MIHYRPARFDDIATLASQLRPADDSEVRAASGEEPDVALYIAYSVSDSCYVACDEHGPLAIFGLAGVAPWMLGTERVMKYRFTLVKAIKRHLKQFYWSVRKPLVNFIHTKNVKHVEFLNLIGVAWGETKIINNEPFREFTYVPACSRNCSYLRRDSSRRERSRLRRSKSTGQRASEVPEP